MAGEPRLDPVGVALAQLLRPGAVADVELARGVALHLPRQLLELDPEDPLAVGRAARVDRQRLAADDGRLGRKQAALGLVDRARDAVEAGRQVDDRRLRRAARRRPSAAARRARSGSASPSGRSGSACRLRRRGSARVAEQPAVELGRRHVRDHGAVGRDRLAVGRADTGRPAVRDQDRLDLRPGLAVAAVVADQRDERLGELRAAAARHRHPALLDRDRDHLGHEARRRRVGAEARVEHPRREQAVGALATRTSSVSQSRRETSMFPANSASPRRPSRRSALRAERGAGARPELGPEHAEGEVGVRHEAVERPPARPRRRRARAGRAPPRSPRPSGAGTPPRRPGRRGRRRQLGVQVLEPAGRELVAEHRVRGAADPERMPGGEHVVVEAGLGDLRRLDRAAEPVVALEHADAPAARASSAAQASELIPLPMITASNAGRGEPFTALP